MINGDLPINNMVISIVSILFSNVSDGSSLAVRQTSATSSMSRQAHAQKDIQALQAMAQHAKASGQAGDLDSGMGWSFQKVMAPSW